MKWGLQNGKQTNRKSHLEMSLIILLAEAITALIVTDNTNFHTNFFIQIIAKEKQFSIKIIIFV